MSELLTTPFKKPECTDMFQLGNQNVQAYLRDVLGGLINLQAVGTDPDYEGAITLTDTDYVPTAGNVNPDGTFFIIPETDAATYIVVFADGTQFTITGAQSTAYLGQIYPGRFIKVIASGTTGSFSVVY